MASEPSTTKDQSTWARLWARNRSIVLMIVAQLISSLMAVAAKLLQTVNAECGALKTSQVLITMMSITMMSSWMWMLLTRVEHAPWGMKSLWPLLTIRGIAGVFGIWGFYYSLRTLALSEATVINFLAPTVATFATTCVGRESFTISHQAAGAVSVIGVALASQPWRIFTDTHLPIAEVVGGNVTACANCTVDTYIADDGQEIMSFTSIEHLRAIGAGLVGVAGGACAFVVIAVIGKNANPAITVNHFSTWTVLLTGLSFVVTGFEGVRMPNLLEWCLLVFLGSFALLLQMLQTASLQGEGVNKALNMVYTQIIFALIMDKAVWDKSPNVMSLSGGAMILASVAIVAVIKEKERKGPEKLDVRDMAHEEEEIELMVAKEERDSEDEDD